MNTKIIKNNSGFVILFAVTLAAILLSIALGAATIAEKEIKFGTSAKDTNDAFAAADTGIECALFYDKSDPGANAFTGTASMNCVGTPITVTPSGTPPDFWTFAVTGVGSASQSCAKVTVDKTDPSTTTITSKGYNIGSGSCDPNNPNRIERELEVSYSSGATTLAVQNVSWKNLAGVSAPGNDLTKTAANGWGNAGASSTQSIGSGDGYIEFSSNENNSHKMAGLSNGDTDRNYTDIDYGMYPATGGSLQVYERGVYRGTFGTYAANDIFRVAAESGVVKYYKNGALVYTSTQAPTYPLLLDTALYDTTATITNAKIAF